MHRRFSRAGLLLTVLCTTFTFHSTACSPKRNSVLPNSSSNVSRSLDDSVQELLQPRLFEDAQISIDKSQIAAGDSAQLILRLTSDPGKKLTLASLPLSIQLHGGTSLGTFSVFTRVSQGVYSAKFMATRAGSPSSIETTLNGKVIGGSASIVISVVPGALSAKRSTVSFDLSQRPIVQTNSESLSLISGQRTAVKFQAYDLFGNRVVNEDLEVSFSIADGASTARFEKTINHGDGTYTAELIAVGAAGPAHIQARANRVMILSPLPTLTVLPASFDPKNSEVLAEKSEIRAGENSKITIRARDKEKNLLLSGVLSGDEKFSFEINGGTSTGEISGIEDKGNGTYEAFFVGHTAGSKTHLVVKKGKTTIGQRIDVTVVPGRPDPARSQLSCAASRISPAGSLVCTLTLKDTHDNIASSASLPTFELRGGTTSGAFSPAQSSTPGIYTTVFKPRQEGSPALVAALIDGVAATIAQPQLQVVFPSLERSTIQVEKEKLPIDGSTTVRFQARDENGNALPIEGLEVAFKAEAGNDRSVDSVKDGSEVEFSRAQDRGEGLYEATMTGVKPGQAKSISLTIAGREFAGAKPTIVVH